MKIFGIEIGENKAKGSGSCCGPEGCVEPASVAVGAEAASHGAGAVDGQNPAAIKATAKG